MQRHFVAEIMIFAVERKCRLLEENDPRVRSALFDAVFRSRRDHDNLVPRRWPRDQFAINIGFNAPALR